MNRLTAYTAAALLGLAVLGAQGQARAQANQFYIGQLQQFGTNWCPEQWARADGSLLSIAQNTVLFSLIGTQFGGDGVNTFALPDLRGRAPMGASNSAPVGLIIGQSATTLSLAQLPMHTHGFFGDPTPPVSNGPANSMMGLFGAGQPIYAPTSATPDTPMNPTMVQPAGQSMPMSTQMPVLATNWCIALAGVYPSRP